MHPLAKQALSKIERSIALAEGDRSLPKDALAELYTELIDNLESRLAALKEDIGEDLRDVDGVVGAKDPYGR